MVCLRLFLLILLIPLGLYPTDPEGTKQIYLAHDWPRDPNDQTLFTVGPLKSLTDALKLKQTTIKVTDLSKETDSPQLTYVVVKKITHSNFRS